MRWEVGEALERGNSVFRNRSSAIGHRSSVIGHWSSVIAHRPSAIVFDFSFHQTSIDLRSKTMAICELHYFSSALQKQTAANVIFPENESGPFPVLYLLHGLSDDHTIWMRRTSLERYVEGLPLIIVMPDGGRGFYTDAAAGFAYETALIRDLIGLVDRTFQTQTARRGRCISGLSMGGYGALKLGLKHPDLFCSAVSHSGALNFGQSGGRYQLPEFARILGDPSTGKPHSLYALAETVDRSLVPALRIDCGTDDELIENNREFHAHLTNLGLPHEYEEFPGGHNWAYWDTHVQEAIRFHAKHLGITAQV